MSISRVGTSWWMYVGGWLVEKSYRNTHVRSSFPFTSADSRMSRENSYDSTSFLTNLIHPLPPSFIRLDSTRLDSTRLDSLRFGERVWWRGVLLVGMALDRQGRCETNRDTKRKLFCICTCSYTTASSPENDDRIHCFRKSSRRQLAVRSIFSMYFPTMFIFELLCNMFMQYLFLHYSLYVIVVLLRIEYKLFLDNKMEGKTRLWFNLLRWNDVSRTSRTFCSKIVIFSQF